MSSKVSALTQIDALADADAIYVVDASGATNADKNRKTLLSQFATYLAGLAAWLPFSKLTGAIAISQIGVAASYIGTATFVADINMNSANTDHAIPISLPSGFTRFALTGCRIFGANGTCTTATFGLFTAASGGGFAAVASGTACTVSTASEDTNGNLQNATVVNAGGQTYALASVPNVYFRVQTPQGAARTAKVAISIIPLP